MIGILINIRLSGDLFGGNQSILEIFYGGNYLILDLWSEYQVSTQSSTSFGKVVPGKIGKARWSVLKIRRNHGTIAS